MKNVLALIFLTTSIIHVRGAEVNSSQCGDGGWIPYKDVKCVKLFKTFLTRLQAQQHCHHQVLKSDNPSLVTIMSAAEQVFLNEYVFNSSNSNSVWIGAERRPGSETAFDWIDGTPVERFTNWRIGSPSSIVERQCVQMQSIYSRQLSDMEWTDISCNGASWFICQKLQVWPIEQLQRAFLNTRKELQHSIEDFTDQLTEIRNLIIDMRDEMRSGLTDVRNEMTKNRNELGNELRNEMQSETTSLRNEMTNSRNELENEMRYEIRSETASLRNEMTNSRDELENEMRYEMRSETTIVRNEMTTMGNSLTGQLETLQANPVPIGFIYVQLSGQPEPGIIWNAVTWTEVTSQYAGLFFRAVGGNSTAFGSIQEGFSPGITEVLTFHIAGSQTEPIQFPFTDYSWISISAPFPTTPSTIALRFSERLGEVRPRNSAIRIWRRSQ